MKKIQGQVMYMGPHVRFLGLGFSRLYWDGIEESLYEWITRCPALGALFVPVTEVGAVLRELDFDYAHNMRGTKGPYVTFYREVQKWLTRAEQQQQPKPSGVTIKESHA